MMSDPPEWTFQGGYFRSGLGANDVPSNWYKRKGKWIRNEIVPFGKASAEYRNRYYRCPECNDGVLIPERDQRLFDCSECSMQFTMFFGSLTEKPDENRYTPEDY